MDKAKKSIIRIYTADITPLENALLFEKAYNTVSQRRREKADKMRQQNDKLLSLGAECLLIRACRDFGIDYNSQKILTDKNSKPSFEGNPLYFNLSHSEKRVMCVMSDLPVGCDTEKIHETDMRIVKRFFSDDECAAVEGCTTDEERENLFFRLWVLKESFMKCTGLGFSLPLNSFSISLGDTIRVKQSVDKSRYCFLEKEMNDGYKYGVCVKEMPDETDVEWIKTDLNFISE